ncbi:hypothetical protein [Clostridium pasteurianum]|uniref:hypothetical protein n=1 Tax=Clostridium pasteurianum TaxID=1501 RepID=UPI00039E8186|nr:hypothetical protein [Clostridium pasteurianum]
MLSIQVAFLHENIRINSEKAFLAALARLYTLRAAYNPRNLYLGNIIKFPLPTYSFENTEYKVSFV